MDFPGKSTGVGCHLLLRKEGYHLPSKRCTNLRCFGDLKEEFTQIYRYCRKNPWQPLGVTYLALLLLLLSRFSRVRLCATPQTAAHCWPCCHITMGLSSRGAVPPSPAVTVFTLSARSIHRGFSASPLDISYIQLNLCITSVPTLAIQIVRM